MMKQTRIIIAILMLAVISACSSPQQAPYAGVKVGKRYEISGRWYEPSYDEHYDEIGMASWYGPGFHGGRTANGERFDENALTAAHRTLPMPSIVRVTNLSNGKSAIIKVNDRGPFARSRIIDLSKAAATKLGVIRTGTAKVRVQFLDQETREYVQNMSRGTQYAMRSLQKVNPEVAGEREEALRQPQYRDVPPSVPVSEQVAMNTVQADPLPAHVIVEPETQLQSQARYESDTDNERESDNSVFSVVDDANAESVKPQFVERRLPSDATNGSFFVQAGTFGLKENAHRLLRRLSAFGSSQVAEVTANEKRVYRVLMGPYDMQADAKNMLSKLAAIGIPDAKIIRN